MDPVIALTIRLATGLLFVAALAHKLRDPMAFVRVLAAHRLVPPATTPAAASVVVAAECAIVVALAGAAPRAGLGLAAALLVVYAAVIARNLLRGRVHLDCGCVGAAGRARLSWWLVGRNVACAAAAVAATMPVAARPLGPLDGATVVMATAALAALYAAADGLVANAPGGRRLREAA